MGTGDAVFVPDFTFFSSGECLALLGAVSVFVDVRPDTYNIDSDSLEDAVLKIKKENRLTPRAVITVDLFGLPADYSAVRRICDKYGLLLIEDGAQGFGGCADGKKACSFGDVSTTSFFPAKPLGCYGDGGAIFTDRDDVAALCRSIAVYGKNADDKYDNVRLGMNSRLDTLQAAVLIPKLKAFADYELNDVNQAASMYTELLGGVLDLRLPSVPDGCVSSWAQYTVQLPQDADLIKVQKYLKEASVSTMVYYAKPMHRQRAFANTRSANADCPVTESLCERVLCLPIHPYLEKEEIYFAAEKLKEALKISRENGLRD